MSLPTSLKPTPAWHEPLVWLVFGIPALTVVAGLITVWIAVQRADSNVAEDYYKRGLAINRSLDREARAQALELVAEVRLSADRSLTLRLSGKVSPPESILLTLTHPVHAEQDRRVVLQRGNDGLYRAVAAPIARVAWDLAIESLDWRITARHLALPDGAQVRIAAGSPQH
jgi:hypothetical protein